MKKIKSFKEFIYIVYNKFFNISIDNVVIPKNSSGLIRAYLGLKKSKIKYSVDRNDICLNFSNYKVYNNKYDESILMSLSETIDDEYNLKEINLKNKIVIDIGANIGDTALKFINHGAKKVFVIEPIKETYKYLLKNIKINKLENRIIPFNIGIGQKNETLKIHIRKYASGGNSIFYKDRNKDNKLYNSKTEVKVFKLDYLKKNIKSKVDLIKIDCEGCEYSIIKNNNLIRFFDPKVILIEYHNGEKNIISWLSNNYFHIKKNIKKNKNVGLITAIKK